MLFVFDRQLIALLVLAGAVNLVGTLDSNGDDVPICTSLVLFDPQIRLETARSLGPAVSFRVSTQMQSNGKGAHVLVFHIARGCGGSDEQQVAAKSFPLRIRAEVQASPVTCKLPRDATATFMLNGRAAEKCFFESASWCESILEVPHGPTHSIALLFSASGYTAPTNPASAASGGEGGALHAAGASTLFKTQIVTTCATTYYTGHNAGSSYYDMWAWEPSPWGISAVNYANEHPGFEETRVGESASDSDMTHVQQVRDKAFFLWEKRVTKTCPTAAVEVACRDRGGAGECGGHGRCSAESGWCFCWGDWFGANCDYHPYLNSSFLPPASSFASRCARVLQWSIGKAAIAAVLERVQSERCQRRDTLLVDTTGLALGGQVLAAGGGQGGRECFFHAKIGCGPGVLAAVKGSQSMRARGVGGEVLEHIDTEAVRGGLAPRGLLRDMRAQGVVGMHVRRGDACVHAAQSNTRPLCRPLTDYLAPLAEMRDLYKAHTVFLSTDDAQVERDAPALLAQMGLRVVGMAMDRSIFSSSWFIEHRVEARALDGEEVAESMVVDLQLLAECDYFVGTLSSQMSRLALALISQRLGRVPPYVSVEGMSWGCCTWAGESLEGLDKRLFRALSFHDFT